jgi:hypothetical protein
VTSATSNLGDGRIHRHLIRSHFSIGGGRPRWKHTTAMSTHHDPDDEEEDNAFFDDFDFNDSWALSNEDGWFYSDDD